MSIRLGMPAPLLSRDGADDPCDYLSIISPKDKKWHKLKANSLLLATAYARLDYERYAERIYQCAPFLQFKQIIDPETGTLRLKLTHAEFCRVRLCPICQWRKSLMWFARFAKALPLIREDYPKSKFLFLTLTVRNCPVEELRSTLVWMNKSWQRLIQRKAWPAQGFARSTEVTRSAIGEAHPHFHCLMMVPGHYRKGGLYVSQEKWIQLWQQSLRTDYGPGVHITEVKPKRDNSNLHKAVAETFKYSVKSETFLINDHWVEQVSSQLHKMRTVSIGGAFKQYMSEEDPEDLIGSSDEEESGDTIAFGWKEDLKRYTI